jgi:hypothetical protein
MNGMSETKNSDKKSKKSIIWSAIAIVSAILALASWSVSSPVGSSPDDDYHNVSIWCGQGTRDDLCEESQAPNTVLVPQPVYSNAFCFAGQPDKSGDCTQSKDLVETIRVNNFQNLYPQGYYWVMSWFASTDVNSSILTMRLFNSIFAVMFIAALVAALPLQMRKLPLVGLLATSIPLGVFVISSVNPSSWTLVSVIAFFSSILALLSAEHRREKLIFGAFSFTSLIMGFSARPDAPAYLLLAGLLALVLGFSFRNIERRTKLAIVLLIIFASVFVILRYVYPLFAALRGVDFGLGESTPTLQGLMFNIIRLPDLFVGAFGTWGMGWLDTPSPSSVWAVTYAIYAGLVFSSIRFFDRRQAIAAGIAFLALVAVPLQFLWANNLSVGQIIQPRYLLPMLALLLSVSLYKNPINVERRLTQGQIWIIGFGLFAANTIALHTNLRRYITGLDINQISLNFEMEWWWFDRPSSDTIFWLSPNYLWLAGSFAFGLFLFSLWKLRDQIGLLESKSTSN